VAPLDVSVVVPYTGEPWRTWAHERAIPTAERLGVPVHIGEGDTVAEARNAGLDQVATKWVIHLDADDELPPDYVEQMATGTADVRAPAVSWARRNTRRFTPPAVPKVWGHLHDYCAAECLAYGNYLVVGALVLTELAQRVRWQEEPVYEDWSFWVRCWQAGATFETIPSAVYMAYSRRGGRNTSLPGPQRYKVHQDIARANGLPIP
jgi:glycosyltransferase involved in cell wall biosynthesis